MATTKLGNSKSASRMINYAEKRAVVKSGLNCDVDFAKSDFKQLRMLYNKDTGVQVHTIIQSFKPGETTPEQANEIGLKLAESIAKGFQVAVYTHDDTDHIHNHIVINSVSIDSGKKYQSNSSQLERIKNQNDKICTEFGLSIVQNKTSPIRFQLAEKALLEKGLSSWKDELREAIDSVRERTFTLENLKEDLKSDFNIDVKLRGETISFKHPDNGHWVRGSKLGYNYEKGGLEDDFERRLTEETRISRNAERNNSTERTDEIVSSSDDGQIISGENSAGQRTIEYPKNVPTSPNRNEEYKQILTRSDEFDFTAIQSHTIRLRKSAVDAIGKWQERNEIEQRTGSIESGSDSQRLRTTNERDRKHTQSTSKTSGRTNAQESKKHRKSDHGFDR